MLVVIDATAVPPIVTAVALDKFVPLIVMLPPAHAGVPAKLVIAGLGVHV